MADSKISALAAATALAGTEVVPIVQGGSTVRTTAQDIANLLVGNLSALSAAHTSLVDRVSANSGAGGGGSVTSAEYLSLVNRVSANSGVGGGGSVTSAEVVNAVSVEAANRTSADNVLSAAVAAVSAQHTSLAGSVAGALSAIVANSAQMTSADNAVSAAVAAVSAQHTSLAASVAGALSAIAANSAQMTSADNAISNAASIVSVAAANALSVANAASNKGSTLSVNLASVDGRVNSLQSSLSTVTSAVAANSAQMTSADNAISNAVSIVSVAVASLASVMSSRTSAIQANSAQMTSADNAISNAVSIVSVAAANAISGVNAVSQRLSALVLDSILNVSAPSPTSGQVLKYNSAALQWVASADATGGGGGSVTSNELSAEAQGLSLRIDSAFAATSNYASIASQAASAASHYASVASHAASVASAAAGPLSVRVDSVANAVSVVSAAHASLLSNHVVLSNKVSLMSSNTQVRIVSNTQSTNGSALVDISGLVLTIAADETWEVNGMLLVSTSAATVGFKGGCSVGVLSLPRYMEFQRISGGQSAGIMGGAGLMQVSGTSQFLSLAALGGVLVGIKYTALFNVASAGTFRMQYAGIASTAASPVHIMPGSYLRAVRLK